MRIIIVGTGKVAYQLSLALKNAGHEITGAWGRSKEKAENFAQHLNTKRLQSLQEIQEIDLVLICVSDSAIAEVLAQIPSEIKTAYTSGSIRFEDLPKRKYLGVFYPLQTFSEESSVNISEVPFLIEAQEKDFETELKLLAKSLSSTVLIANSQDRYNLHIAAVMVNNFTNFLYHLAEEHLKEHHLDFNILKPLIKETVKKLDILVPLKAQTGPAVRGDKNVINKHLDSITSEGTKELYRLFSSLIEKEIKKNEL